MAFDPITLEDLPDITPSLDKWGAKVNGTFADFRDAVTELQAAVQTLQSGAFVSYDPSTGWPTVPTSQVAVFISTQYPSATAPTGGADGSVWLKAS